MAFFSSSSFFAIAACAASPLPPSDGIFRSNSTNPSSSMHLIFFSLITFTFLGPASCPMTTRLVFPLIDLVTFAPYLEAIRTHSSLSIVGKIPVKTTVRPFKQFGRPSGSNLSPLGAGASAVRAFSWKKLMFSVSGSTVRYFGSASGIVFRISCAVSPS
ncbi:hypothetical protein OGAPHI_004844 [Ogataea philodendri]|uniref:Secreted protein n=1 Tax=Ogataea philodendri TaxID=1378263 RepID=A0A9P8T3L7_9ASCO|nr:uncharacterized protein OGAPHI_004844 [Ogataea philodendri]KAH3664130.1 hypothetical protein OGAPHI_004844 [Ogataea philodendri]